MPEAGLHYEYRILREHSHNDLEDKINDAARDGWEPVMVYAWNTDFNHADHACLLRRVRS